MINIAAPLDSTCETRVLVVDRPGENLEHELRAQDVTTERTCPVCGRGQVELLKTGQTLRFLCPDEVCTSCLADAAAAQRGLLVAT